jgi:hypothetical protein
MSLYGVKEQTVVLAGQPFELDSTGRTFTSKEPLKVVGYTADTCVVLKSNYPLRPQPQVDRDFADLLHGAHITTRITTTKGKTYQFDSVGQAWDLYGPVSSKEELSACISCGCKPQMPAGTEIRSIDIKSDRPLNVLGAYWQSTSAFDNQ